MMSRSAWTTLAMSGRRTFRATVRPSRRTARWTCEIDAEATGVGSSDAKTSRGRPAVLLAQDRLDLVERERPDVVAQRRPARWCTTRAAGPAGCSAAGPASRTSAPGPPDQPKPAAPGPAAGPRRPARPARSAAPAPPGAAPRPRPGSRTAPGSPGSAGSAAGRGDGRPFRESSDLSLPVDAAAAGPVPRPIARAEPGRLTAVHRRTARSPRDPAARRSSSCSRPTFRLNYLL